MQAHIHAFTDKCCLYFYFLNTEGHRLFTCLNCINAFTFYLSSLIQAMSGKLLTPPTTVRLDKSQSTFSNQQRCYSIPYIQLRGPLTCMGFRGKLRDVKTIVHSNEINRLQL